MRLKLLFSFVIGAWLAAAPPVLFLSFDGLAAQSFNAKTMPRLWKLAQAGKRGEGLPPFPSTTFNGHATLATGCWPEHHGIVSNSFVDPVRGFVPYTSDAAVLQREPLWVASTRGGVKTGVYHWPCATGPWEGVLPWRLENYKPGQADSQAMDFSEAALKEGAELVMAYFSGMDVEGHTQGPASPETVRKLKRTDDEVAPWLERVMAGHPGLRVVLTADHGMATMRIRIQLPSVLKGCFTRIIAHGGSAYVYTKPGRIQVAKNRLKAAGLQVWERADLPENYHLAGNQRVGDLIVQAPTGTWLSNATGPALITEKSGRKGAHAYDSSRSEMHTWLVVLGDGQGDLGEVPLWDIAPTIASWLGFKWAVPADGKPFGIRSSE
ncbi:MAG: alkaline phosphatase family protein [Holophagaceae bacterium]|nr:alkaline phosphatase family protein [Holophagaceae bacterium]